MMPTPRPKRRTERNRRGGALLEFALFAPVLLYMLVAVGDFGRYYIEASRLGDVAVEAAREAARGERLQESGEDGPAAVRVEVFCVCPAEPASRFSCGAESCGSYGEPARYAQASVEKSFSFLARYPGVPSHLTMRRKAGVRIR